jgi:hypothetical protein
MNNCRLKLRENNGNGLNGFGFGYPYLRRAGRSDFFRAHNNVTTASANPQRRLICQTTCVQIVTFIGSPLAS